nr:hypothetical protein [Legionella norrlandica]
MILSIVQTENIAEQSDLQHSLKKRGYDIPQATLSRRLKKMKIAKVSGYYKVIDYNQPGLPLVLNIQFSDFGLIILQTTWERQQPCLLFRSEICLIQYQRNFKFRYFRYYCGR